MTLVQQDLKKILIHIYNTAFDLIQFVLDTKPDGRPAAGKVFDSKIFHCSRKNVIFFAINLEKSFEDNGQVAIERKDLVWL